MEPLLFVPLVKPVDRRSENETKLAGEASYAGSRTFYVTFTSNTQEGL
jgi:hypothetical protein